MASRRDSAGWRAVRRLGGPARPLYNYLVGRRHVLPDFLILGAMKAGTSSLYAYLREHPQVMGPAFKEVHFFDHVYARGPYWYRRNFPTREQVAEQRQRLGKPVAVGEATPCYLFQPAAAARIHDLLPEARLIVLLRDPVARAFSHYRQRVRQGQEPLSFTDALAAEEERLAGAEQLLASGRCARVEAHHRYSYRSRSLYLPQLRRYYDRMSADRILVVKSEDMYRDPQAAFDQVVDFLRLDRWQLQAPQAWNSAPDASGPIPGEAQLRAWFEPHNQALADFLGRDMGW